MQNINICAIVKNSLTRRLPDEKVLLVQLAVQPALRVSVDQTDSEGSAPSRGVTTAEFTDKIKARAPLGTRAFSFLFLFFYLIIPIEIFSNTLSIVIVFTAKALSSVKAITSD